MELLRTIFPYLIGLSLAAVLGIMLTGIATMARGGQAGGRHSNKMMRLRVISQAVAILLLGIYVMFIRA